MIRMPFCSLCLVLACVVPVHNPATAWSAAPPPPPVVEAALAPDPPKASSLPLGAGADAAGGYAGQVLETLLPLWEPPEGASGVVLVALRLSSEGRLLFCETKRGSGNPKLDESPCLAALKPKTFGPPPYGAVTEVYLTLATDRAALLAGARNTAADPAPAPAPTYAEQVMRAVRPHLAVPPNLGGKFAAEVNVRIVPKDGAGGVEQISVFKASGRGDVDAAILAAICTPGILPLPPEGGANLRLSFTVESN